MKARPAIKTKTRIAIVESDPLRLIGLKALLDCVPDFELFHGSLEEVLAEDRLQVAVLGNPCTQPFFDAVAQLKSARAGLPIIVTGPTVDLEIIYRAVDSGVKGYVNEAGQADELVRAIRAVNSGLIWVPRAVVSMFVERMGRTQAPNTASLTSREKQVLEMLVGGRSNKEIAAPLGIEERTVKAHVAKMMRKVGVSNRVALSVHAFSRLRIAAI